MSLPMVVSALNVHSMQIQNMRNGCVKEAYLKKHGLIKDSESHLLKSSKVCLHNRKCLRKRVKKKSTHRKGVTVDQNDSEAKESEIDNVTWNKKKKNQGKPTTSMLSKNQTSSGTSDQTHTNDLNSSSTVIICSVRKLITSYSTKNMSTFPQQMWKNPKLRPQTSLRKKKSGKEDNTKRQSCPPPLFQPSESLEKNVKLKKVYYSEAQSRMLYGVPCVPPTSPLNDEVLAVEIVPCLTNIKSQQTMKTKLRRLVSERQKADEKMKEKVLKEQKRKEKEQIESLKQQRRAEIYALNEIMAEYERTKFQQFMTEKKNGPTTISLNV